MPLTERSIPPIGPSKGTPGPLKVTLPVPAVPGVAPTPDLLCSLPLVVTPGTGSVTLTATEQTKSGAGPPPGPAGTDTLACSAPGGPCARPLGAGSLSGAS